jgi:hypothetical protein
MMLFAIQIFTFISVIAVNFYWYSIKLILRKNNIKSNLYWHVQDDFGNFRKLISKLEDEGLKKEYKKTLKKLTFFFILSIVAIFLFVVYAIFNLDLVRH